MNRHTDWQATLMQEDALLFNAARDGAETMRAVPKTEWEARRAKNDVTVTRQSVADVIRKVVSGDNASSVVLADTSISLRTAAPDSAH